MEIAVTKGRILIRWIALPLLLGLLASPRHAEGQEQVPLDGVVGVMAPADIPVAEVDDTEWARFLSGVKVLGEGFAAYQGVRVVSGWGPHARLDGGVLASNVFIALNNDGTEFTAYQIGPLLNPEVRRITTEADEGVVYLVYGGLGTQVRCARVRVLPGPLQISEAAPEHCPVP
jgi:hypothetical protein